MEDISLKMMYSELKELKKEIELMRNILIPEEEIDDQELEEIIKIEKEMKKGEKVSLEDILKEI